MPGSLDDWAIAPVDNTPTEAMPSTAPTATARRPRECFLISVPPGIRTRSGRSCARSKPNAFACGMLRARPADTTGPRIAPGPRVDASGPQPGCSGRGRGRRDQRVPGAVRLERVVGAHELA